MKSMRYSSILTCDLLPESVFGIILNVFEISKCVVNILKTREIEILHIPNIEYHNMSVESGNDNLNSVTEQEFNWKACEAFPINYSWCFLTFVSGVQYPDIKFARILMIMAINLQYIGFKI